MAIHKQILKKTGINAAAIVKSSTFATCYRVRLTEAEIGRSKGCNVIRLYNKSSLELEVVWELNNEASHKKDALRASGTHNINAEDGRTVYGFDVYNLNAATDVAIGEFSWSMARVLEVPEAR